MFPSCESKRDAVLLSDSCKLRSKPFFAAPGLKNFFETNSDCSGDRSFKTLPGAGAKTSPEAFLLAPEHVDSDKFYFTEM